MEFHEVKTKPDANSILTGNSVLSKSQRRRQYFVTLWHNSQLSQSEFCRQQGLNIKTFSNWCKQFDAAAKAVLPEFNQNKNPHKISEQSSREFECSFPNGVRLSYRGYFDTNFIDSVMKAISACKFN